MAHPLDEMKQSVGFDERDASLLANFWPTVAPEVKPLVNLLRDALRAPGRATEHDGEPEALERTLEQWLEQLIRGPYDERYYDSRVRIGRMHFEAGLPPQLVFTSMHVIRRALCDLAWRTQPVGKANDLCTSLDRVTSVDAAIMAGTYVEGATERDLETLSDLVVSHLPVTVLMLDRSGAVTAATRPGTRLFGPRSILGAPFTEAFPRVLVDAADLEAVVDRAIESKREITIPRVDVTIEGRQRSFQLSVVPLEHTMASVLLHVEELTEAIEAEARLARAETLAQLGALSAAVAHELRNPLAGISGAIQVIARTLPEEDRRRAIMEKVEAQVYRLNAMVSDLLAFARQDPTQPETVDLRALVDELAGEVRVEHPALSLRVEGEGTAWADPALVRQAIAHVVQNAAQATDGQGEVLVAVEPGSILVSDSGPGIPDENREAIFRPFFTTRMRGTGLGLAIALKNVREMGGELTLERGPLRGAGVRVRLARQGPAAPASG